MEARETEFRNYLETTGALRALTEALINLFDLTEKPEDAISFIRLNLGNQSNGDEENAKLKVELEKALERVKELESHFNLEPAADRTKSNGNQKEILLAGLEELEQDSACNSLLKKHLTRELIDELANFTTQMFQSSLYDCVKVGLDHHELTIGIRALDEGCYKTFKKVFDPIIREYHQGLPEELEHPQPDWWNADAISNPDAERNFISECSIFSSRSIESFPFAPKMNEDQLKDVMKLIRETLDALNETDFKGHFHAYEAMDNDTRSRLIGENVAFGNSCEMSRTTGCYELWPKGRAVYISDDKVFHVQINNRNHLRFGCVQKDGDLKSLFVRMAAFTEVFDANLSTVRHSKYGYLTACPSLLGNTLEVFATLRLAKLSHETDKLNEILVKHSLKIENSINEENGKVVLELKSAKCLGVTEFETVKGFVDGLGEIIQAEK